MKRKIMAMALAASMAATMLAGCSGGGSNVETTKAAGENNAQAGDNTAQAGDNTAGEAAEGYESYKLRTDLTKDDITLTVWESGAGPDEFIKQAGEKFTALYPNIKVEYVNVESNNAKDQIASDGPAGIGPDLFAAANDNLGVMASAGSIMPIDDIDASFADSVKNGVAEMSSKGVTYDGKVWGFPVARETYTIFYNKDLIDSVPSTWEELVKVCKDWNSKHGKDEYALMWQVGNTYHNVMFLTSKDIKLFGPNCDDYSNGTGFGNETSIAGAKFFQSLRKEILDVNAESLDEATTVAAFESGKCAMIIDGSWKINAYKDSVKNLGATTLPSLPGQDQPSSNFAGIRTMYVSYYSKNQKEAAAFGEFMLCKEMQQLRYDITKALPSVDTLTIDDEIVNVFFEQLKYAFAMPAIPQINQYWTAYNSAYKNMWNGEDVETTISEAENVFKMFVGN